MSSEDGWAIQIGRHRVTCKEHIHRSPRLDSPMPRPNLEVEGCKYLIDGMHGSPISISWCRTLQAALLICATIGYLPSNALAVKFYNRQLSFSRMLQSLR